MNETTAISEADGRPPRIARLRHTLVLVGILLAIAAYGVYGQMMAAREPTARGSALPTYLGLLAAEWALVRYVMVGLRGGGTTLRDLLGERWRGLGDVARDAVLALAVFLAWTAVASAADRMTGSTTSKAVQDLLPRGPAEIAVWVLLSLSAGFCEEVVYRGYLQRQFHALTGSALAAVLIQAVLFGISHGYQGVRNVILITLYGTIFGVLAWWRRSLKPGMILHAWTDVVGGLFQRSF